MRETFARPLRTLARPIRRAATAVRTFLAGYFGLPYAGYAGWGPGQLEGEIARGDWTLEPASAGAIFGGTEHPWPAPGEAGSGRRI